jgi:hypothetical protein
VARSDLSKLNDQKFDRSGHHLSSIGHVPRGGMIFAVHAICYFVNHDLRDRDGFVGPGPHSTIILLVLGLIPRPGCLFQASVICGLCQSIYKTCDSTFEHGLLHHEIKS